MIVNIHGRARHYRTVTFDAANNAVRLIEQRLLPHQFKVVATRDFRETARAIRDMIVRGAPAIATAAAPLYAAQAQGNKFHVFCDETRPRCQGATLTAWELAQQGISHQVIADNAAGHLMQRGEIDLVIVGSDRTLGRTGEVANKIGTYTKAVLAKRHGIPFYVAIPLSTIDWNLKSGFDIPIEERHEHEVLGAWGVVSPQSGVHRPRSDKPAYLRVANAGSGARNPGF